MYFHLSLTEAKDSTRSLRLQIGDGVVRAHKLAPSIKFYFISVSPMYNFRCHLFIVSVNSTLHVQILLLISTANRTTRTGAGRLNLPSHVRDRWILAQVLFPVTSPPLDVDLQSERSQLTSVKEKAQPARPALQRLLISPIDNILVSLATPR